MSQQKLNLFISDAIDVANELNHKILLSEHLLYVLLKDSDIRDMFKYYDKSLIDIESSLLFRLRELPKYGYNISTQNISEEIGRTITDTDEDIENSDETINVALRILLNLMYNAPDSYGLKILSDAGINITKIEEYLSLADSNKQVVIFDSSDDADNYVYDIPLNKNASSDSALLKYCSSINDMAYEGKLDTVIGMEGEINEVINVLRRKKKNNCLLIGEAGVGKSAIPEGLAQRIVSGDVPDDMKDISIIKLDIGSLMSGTKYRGDLEKRLKDVLSEIKYFKKGRVLLFIDEIHMIVGAGASDSMMDISNLLKEELARNGLMIIGATTMSEYRETIEKDNALDRRFQKIVVNEPDIDETIKILLNIKSDYEEHYGCEFSEDTIKEIVNLSEKYIINRHFPDKAIDVMDEAGAIWKGENRRKSKTVDSIFVQKAVAKIANKSIELLTEDDTEKAKRLEKELVTSVIGQKEAAMELTTAFKISTAGLREDNKTQGAFLFRGPSGVGKTEIAKQLAKSLGKKLIRLDMSEYSEAHSISRLIGAPPGYVGYEEGGKVTEPIYRNPEAVLLLDEIEKAHPNIYNVLLQIMDNGYLTDGQGRKTDFRNVIMIMTTNAGSRRSVKSGIGFNSGTEIIKDDKEVERIFSPEFRGRLDGNIEFKDHTPESLKEIAKKFVREIGELSKEKNIDIEVSEQAYKWITDNGFNIDLGARPMHGIIKHHITRAIAEYLIDNPQCNENVTAYFDVDENGNGLKAEFTKNASVNSADKEKKLLLPPPANTNKKFCELKNKRYLVK